MEVDWLNINPLTGGTGETSVYAYVSRNEKIGSTRYATVRFTNNEGLTADLNLSQTSDTNDMRFVVTPKELYVPGIGGTLYTNVLSNTYWKVSSYDSGLTITSDSQEGYGDAVLTIEFPTNPNSTQRTGQITVSSLMGDEVITWVQAAYNSITVTPSKLIFPQSGGSLTATVNASANWSITSYDTDNVSFSTLSGASGETVITVTKNALTDSQIEYYITNSSTAVFSDGVSEAVLNIDSNIDDYYIDDDWITVTYNVPSANTEVVMCAYDTSYNYNPTIQFQDNNYTNHSTKGVQISYERWLTQHYVTFTTPGLHTIKYKFNKGGIILPKYAFPSSGIVGLRGITCYDKIVIGDRCSGYIDGCAAKDAGFKEVILGRGNITLIGEYAFKGCGSLDKDFVLGNNVKELRYQPFHKFKADKFIYDMTDLGGTGGTSTSTAVAGPFRTLIISGSVSTYGSDGYATGTSEVCSWNGYPGDFTCNNFVIGQNVQRVHNTPFYPYGLTCFKSGTRDWTYDWARASATFYNEDSSKIYGPTIPMISSIRKVSPTVDRYSFTPVQQTFRRVIGDVIWPNIVETKGPSRNIPFHYPVGSNYSAWFSSWTNHYGDIDI